MAFFPLNKGARGRDLRNRSPTGRLNHVRAAPGPLGRPGGSIQLLGKRTSYVQFPNRRGGVLDTSYSMTVLAWIYPEGTAGPLFNYHPSARGVHFWLKTPRTLYASFMHRKGRKYTAPVRSRSIQLRKWQFVGATYNRNTGTAALWKNGKKIAKRFIGRIRLATNYPVRMGARSGDRRYFKGRVTCLQVYSVALTAAQVRRAAKKCFKAGESSKIVIFGLFIQLTILFLFASLLFEETSFKMCSATLMWLKMIFRERYPFKTLHLAYLLSEMSARM